MITCATPEHLTLIGKVLAYGGRGGSWDSSLGNGGASLDALLTKLRYAFIHGVLPQIDPRTGKHIETRIAGYVFHINPDAPPIGFGLFKDFSDTGYELWLVGIAEPFRGKGHSRALLSELLATPLGNRVELARCAWASESSRRCSHVLCSLGFAPCRATTSEEWLLHKRTPPSVVQLIRTMDMSPYEPKRSAVGRMPAGHWVVRPTQRSTSRDNH
jgi:GNAT superfamily N-acetyltransferase